MSLQAGMSGDSLHMEGRRLIKELGNIMIVCCLGWLLSDEVTGVNALDCE